MKFLYAAFIFAMNGPNCKKTKKILQMVVTKKGAPFINTVAYKVTPKNILKILLEDNYEIWKNLHSLQ